MAESLLLEKIRKLLALGQSPNEHEAAAAMGKAQELMDAHNIAVGDLPIGEAPAGEYVFHDVLKYLRIPDEFPAVAQLLENYFHVRFVRESVFKWDVLLGYEMKIFGEKHHVEVATYIWTYLTRTFRGLARQRGFRGRQRRTYLMGVSDSIAAKLAAQRGPAPTSGSALIVKRLDTALDKACNGAGAFKIPSSYEGTKSAFDQGKSDGERVAVNDAIGGANRASQRCLPAPGATDG